jgi:hypothetical protein
MSMGTRPFFILSSGRAGSQLMERLFGPLGDVEIHHEYLCTHVQPLAARYYMGRISLDEAAAALARWHGAAVSLSPCGWWGDSSNKLSWLIPVLERVFPDARYVYVVRDGRKVASSYFNKLGDECYDDRSVAALQAHVDDPQNHRAPPPEKKYWWPLPPPGDPRARRFRSYDQFRRICFHWGEINRVIARDLADLPAQRHCMVKLEDLVAAPHVVDAVFDFLGLDHDGEAFERIRRPHNVHVPRDFGLSEAQEAVLMEEAGDVMEWFGYAGSPCYKVRYNV